MLLFRQPCVQFGLQATRPLRDYPRNIGGLSGRGIELFADYSNQERTVQEKGVYREVRRTVTRKYIECVCCELRKWISLYRLEKRLVGEKLLEFEREQQKLEEEIRRKEEEKEEKRRKLEEERRREEEEKEEKRRQLEEEKEESRRKLEEERRREKKEKEEKRRQIEEEKEERRRILEEDRRKEEEEKEERRRREDDERETRRQEREPRKLELEADLLKQKQAIEAAKREHELELPRLAQGRNDTERAEVREDGPRHPSFTQFVDGRDDLDAYLQRFERFATTAKWEKTGWASKLSALLSGRALEVYSRLSEEAAQDY